MKGGGERKGGGGGAGAEQEDGKGKSGRGRGGRRFECFSLEGGYGLVLSVRKAQVQRLQFAQILGRYGSS